jgi:copper chaperone
MIKMCIPITREEVPVSNTIRFKTSMKCAGCVEAVTPGLNALKEVASWKVDVGGAEKTLSVEAEETAIPKVVAALEKAGFKAERIL